MRHLTSTALGIIALDQASKYYVVHVLDLWSRLRIEVLPPYLNLTMAWNQGINFGLFSNGTDVARWGLVVIALAISAFVWIWARRESHRPWVQIAAGAIIGGAIGNVIDRIAYGAVADFLNMSVPGIDNPYSFNIADIAVFAGAIALVFLSGKEKTP